MGQSAKPLARVGSGVIGQHGGVRCKPVRSATPHGHCALFTAVGATNGQPAAINQAHTAPQ